MTTMKVTTPVPGFSGTSAGVHFSDGVGHTDNPAAIRYFRIAGYGVEDAAGAAQADEPDGGEASQASGAAKPPAKSATADVWRAWAVEHGAMSADEAAEMSKNQLVERFTSDKGGEQ